MGNHQALWGKPVGNLEDHAAWCERRGLRASYLADLGRTLRRTEAAVGSLQQVDTETLTRWWDSLTVSAGTRAAYLAQLHSWFRWALREGVRADDPSARLVRPRQRRRLPRPISPEHLRAALDGAENPARAFLLLAALGGLRACECAQLHRDDITDVLLVRDGKGGKQRIVPLHPAVRAELDRLPATGWLFPTRAGRPMTANHVSKVMSRHLRGLGIPATFHQCRHAFATSVYRESLDLRLTQELLGHASPTTTAVYAQWEPARAVSVVAALTIA